MAFAVMGFDPFPGALASPGLASATWQGLHKKGLLLWAGQRKLSAGACTASAAANTLGKCFHQGAGSYAKQEVVTS